MQGRIFYEAADENLGIQVKKGRKITGESVSK
jgi:hypothetical protein